MVESSEHWKVDPLSLEVNAKLAEVEATVPEGPDVSVVCGAVVSLCSTVRRGAFAPLSRLDRTRFADEVVVSARLYVPLPVISEVMSTVLNAPAVSAPEVAATVDETDGAFE